MHDYQAVPPTSIRRAKQALIVAVILIPIAATLGITYYLIGNDRHVEGEARPINAVGKDLKTGFGPNIDSVGSSGWVCRNSFGDCSDDSNNYVTVKLTREQATFLLGTLNEALSKSPGSKVDEKTRATAGDISPSAEASYQSVAKLDAQKSNRLATAMPLIGGFLIATSLVVVLMIFAGIRFVQVGSASGGAKIDVFGMKIDAKGTGIASVACGAVVLLGTIRPLIDAVVTLSHD